MKLKNSKQEKCVQRSSKQKDLKTVRGEMNLSIKQKQ
jgi:hypothetical protein